MSGCVVGYHTDRTEVSFDHDGDQHVVSLTPYLQNPGECVMVVFEVWNENLIGPPRAVIEVGGDERQLVHEGLVHYVDCPSGVNNEVTLSADITAVHVEICAEFWSPGAVMHSSRINRSPTQQSEQNAWINKTVSLEGGDAAGDIEAVILTSLTNLDNSTVCNVGCRGYGSTSTRLWYSTYHSEMKFYVVAAPNAQYQVYVDGSLKSFSPFGIVYEIGYIKSGYGLHSILNYTDEGPSASTWTTRSTTTVPVGAEGMFAIQRETPDQISGGLWFHGLREMSSSDIERICPSVAACDSCDPVKLDDSRQYKFAHYFSTSGTPQPELWIMAYTMGKSASGDGTLVLDATGDAMLKHQASGSGTLVLNGQAAGLQRITADPGMATIRLLGSGAASLPTELVASVDIQDVMTARAGLLSVLAGDVEVQDVLTARPKFPEA